MAGKPQHNPDERPLDKDDSAAERSKLGLGLSMGMELFAGVGLGLLIGYWLDGRYGWSPWGVLIGAMLGLAGGMYLMIKEAIRMQ